MSTGTAEKNKDFKTVNDFAEIEGFIKQNPQQAQEYIQEWRAFLKEHPTAGQVSSLEAWDRWCNEHPGEVQDRDIYVGRKIEDAWTELRQESPQTIPTSQIPAHSSIANAATVPLLIAGIIAKKNGIHVDVPITEHLLQDNDYLQIFSDEVKKANKGLNKDMSQEETVGIGQKAQQIYRKRYPDKTRAYEQKALTTVYQTPQEDPFYQACLKKADESAAKKINRAKLLNRNLDPEKIEKIYNNERKQYKEHFAERFSTPELRKKLTVYSQQDRQLREIHDKLETSKLPKDQQNSKFQQTKIRSKMDSSTDNPLNQPVYHPSDKEHQNGGNYIDKANDWLKKILQNERNTFPEDKPFANETQPFEPEFQGFSEYSSMGSEGAGEIGGFAGESEAFGEMGMSELGAFGAGEAGIAAAAAPEIIGGAALGAEAATVAGTELAVAGGGGIIAFFATPLGWVTLAIIIAFLFFLIILFAVLGWQAQQNSSNQPVTGLTIILKGPTTVPNPTNPNEVKIDYEIDAACDSQCQPLPVYIYDPTPPGTKFVSADGNHSATEPITWKLADNPPHDVTNGINNYIFHITFSTPTPNSNVANTAYGDVIGGNQIPVPGLTLNVSPDQQHVNNGQPISFTITATYAGSDTSVTISNPIPFNTTYLSPNPITDKRTFANNTITWRLADLGKGPYTFVVKLQPTANDITVIDKVYGNAQGIGTGGNASAVIKGIDSADPKQYYSNQWSSWSYSSCSGCAIAAVINAYGGSHGKPIICGDVLQYEYDHGYYIPNPVPPQVGGLQGWHTIVDTANHFGFNADVGQGGRTLQNIIDTANSGKPVVIGVIDHIMDIKGGDSQNIFFADSSPHHYTTISRYDFTHGLPGSRNSMWDGTYAILTPK